MRTPPVSPRADAAHPASLRGFLFLAAALVPMSLPAQTASSPSQTQATQEQTVTLDPFEVQADSDTSYGAMNSRSITAFNTSLDHMPVSADIYDQAFMNDIAATGVEDMINTYSPGAGPSALSAGASAFQDQPGDRVNLRYTQLRGLQTPNVQRNSLLFLGTLGGPGGTSIGQTSNFDLERVDIIFGPEALLYDGGGAGGVINLETKQARFDAPTSGSLMFRTDPYGSKYALLDYSESTGNFAARLAIIDTSNQTRRINIGDHLNGTYLQLAGRFGNTTVRVSLEQSRDHRNAASYNTVTSTGDTHATPYGPAYSTYQAYSPAYLLATNQGGLFDNGNLNWSNVNSYEGWLSGDDTVAEFGMIEADTRWNSWLSTQFSAGMSDFVDDHYMDSGSVTIYSPFATANPQQGNWTESISGAFDGVRPYHGQGLRGAFLLTNDLFSGKAKSQTMIGADTVDNRGGIIQYTYYQADSNWNLITTGPATNLGRIVLPAQNFTINNGPVQYPLFRLGAPRITVNGVNYIRQMVDPMSKALVTQANPVGDALVDGANGLRNDAINAGLYATNYTQWPDSNLDTLFGFRLEHAYTYTARPQTSIPNPTPIEIIESHNLNFNVGADYHLRPWLTPYFSVSDSYLVAPDLQNDPYGEPLPVSHAIGEEVGAKFANHAGTLSGSVALYHSQAINEEFLMTATLERDINPSGLNGVYDSDSTNGYAANAESNGLQVLMTANPTPNWRLRFAAAWQAGKIESNRSYSALYNDQFHENTSGQVTYADGTVVYVAPTFNSKTPAYTQANAPTGSVPLTVTLLSTPGGTYYATPIAATGAITTSSTAAKVLDSVDPTHGAILTGANGLPISAYQLNSALTGVQVIGTIPVAVSGDQTTGYPEFGGSITSVYTIPAGFLKGFEFGGSVVANTKVSSYYYYPNSLTSGTAQRSLFSTPASIIINPLFAYTRKFGRFSFTSQLNISNLFNHYSVIIFPALVTGWTSPSALNANFNGQPRSYAWTNTFRF